ncbi:MAG: ABC transporter ATP-binding protein [Alphaproteobacteria bacterium]|nr:ABC transporter ATP-binding protein [Alphaproteobacteria bacterium]
MATDSILTLAGVVAGYGKLTVLNGVDLRVAEGSITTMIGPNGAGKSTVLKTVFGLLRPTAGEIRFRGQAIAGLSQRALLSLGLAYVPQGRNLFPELTVRHNLELGGITLGDRKRLERRIDAVMGRFPRLLERADAQASTLSGGEQKMLEIGRALLLEPTLLLIDEPSIGLAPKLVGEVFAILRELRESGVTILMVEQNAKAALAVSDDALVLEQGCLAFAAPAAETLEDPKVHALFLGGGLEDGAGGNSAQAE